MTKSEAKKLINDWYAAPRVIKAKTWDKIYPLMNKYPDLRHERNKNDKSKIK